MLKSMINKVSTDRASVSITIALEFALGISGLFGGLANSAKAQSRPPVSSGASGGANPGNASGGSGYNPGGSGSSGGGYNPGNNSGGSGYNPGGGYNPGSANGSGYNPGYHTDHSLIAYRDADFRGASVRFEDEVQNLRSSGFNDEISSIQFRGVWMVCSDAYFRGRCRTFRNDIRNLRGLGLNDQISSIRPVR